jgi:hypothetical protein
VIGGRLFVIDSTYHINKAILCLRDDDADHIIAVHNSPLPEVKL